MVRDALCIRGPAIIPWAVVCLLLSAFPACNSDTTPECDLKELAPAWTPSADIVIDVTEENFCSELARAACATIHECCPVPGVNEEAAEGYYVFSEESCRHFKQLDCEDYYWLGLHGVKTGTIDFDVKQAGKCLENVLRRERECSAFGDATPPEAVCEVSLLFHGTLGQGKPCVGALECQPGLACAGGKTCVKLPGKGEPCVLDEPDGVLRCGPDLYCEADGNCRGALAEGEECQETWQKCAEGLFCARGEGSSSDRCEKKRKNGEPCQGGRYCSSGFCQPGWCVEKGEKGGACHADYHCSVGVCEVSGDVCYWDYDCSKVCPEAGEGPCVPNKCVMKCLGPRVCVDTPVESGPRKLCDDAMQLATVQMEWLAEWYGR